MTSSGFPLASRLIQPNWHSDQISALIFAKYCSKMEQNSNFLFCQFSVKFDGGDGMRVGEGSGAWGWEMGVGSGGGGWMWGMGVGDRIGIQE